MGGGFHSLHPLPAFLYYIGIIAFSMLLNQPLFLVTALVAMLILWLIVDRGKPKRKLILVYVFMALIIILANPIFSRRGATILFYFLDQPLTLESIVYGMLMALSLLIILIAFQSYNRVITADKLMYLFGSISPKGTLVIRMSLRFVPLLNRRWKQVVDVQRTQGLLFGEGSIKKKISEGMQLLSILLTWSLEEAVQTAQSMRARGYGLGKRSAYVHYPLRKQDWLILFFMLLTAGIMLGGQLRGYGVLVIYPRLGSFQLSSFDWLVYLSFCAYLFIPFYLEGKEVYTWRVWKSATSHLPIQKENIKL